MAQQVSQMTKDSFFYILHRDYLRRLQGIKLNKIDALFSAELTKLQAESISTNRAKIDDFVSKSVELFISEHPTWEWNKPNIIHSTICVPPYFESVRKNLENESLAVDQKGSRGDMSEQKVFDALKSLNNGSVVIADIDSVDIEKHARLIWKEYKNSCSTLADIKGGGKNDFQCDFLLFHQDIGIILIEVKSTTGTDVNLPNDAAKKFANTVKKMKLLFNAIDDNDECEIPIKAIFCCPNLKLESSRSIQHEDFFFDIIAGNCSPSLATESVAENLKKYFTEVLLNNTAAENFDSSIFSRYGSQVYGAGIVPFYRAFSEYRLVFPYWLLYMFRTESISSAGKNPQRSSIGSSRKFQTLLSFFSCYRRAIYLNETLNAVEVAKLVDRQNLLPQNSRKDKDTTINFAKNFSQLDHISDVIFLTDEQKNRI